MTLRTLNHGNYGIFLIMGNAGFISSTVAAEFPNLPSRSSLLHLGCTHWGIMAFRALRGFVLLSRGVRVLKA